MKTIAVVSIRVTALAAVLALASCGGPSQVGKLTAGPPVAAAATIGQPYTVDGSGVLHTTVRAGAEVVLSGVNSQSGSGDTGIPIVTWTWQQLNPQSGATVDLVKRTNDAVSFTAPQVTQPATLAFQLTVTDANGGSASTQAQVVVEPVRDPDHFLAFLNTRDTFTVTAGTSAVVAPEPQATYSDTVPYTITVTKLVTYTDLAGAVHTRVPVGQPVAYQGGWSSAVGSGGPSCSDARNPQTLIPIPRLNLDDLLADGSGQRLSDVMETSDIDLDPANPAIPPAFVEAQVQIASNSLPSGVSPQLCVTGDNGAPSASVTLKADVLLTDSNSTGALYDTSASAHTYYSTIDPNGAKTTLAAWLQANGFNPSDAGWGADAHAVYTNDYDLGFGRDMYLKVGACDAGFSAAPLSQFANQALSAAAAQTVQSLIGHCDVAAVVVNYAGVQTAAQHLNAIVAVAMEYSASPGGGPRFVKFYVFAPDTRTGAMERVTGVDLDRRGQKPVPQACVVCHGGVPATLAQLSASTAYPHTGAGKVNGDLDSAFLPWDVSSLLFSDTDPGFSQKAQDAALKAQYTAAKQADQLKLLNVGAYLTMADPVRSALQRELLEGWYGGAGLPSAYNGSFVPPEWQPAGDNDNPADSATLYTDAFAHTCRMCHTAQAPPSGVDPRTASGSDANGATVPACSPAAVRSSAAVGDQVPIGCYGELANGPNLAMRLSDGTMPFARRTLDRLWVQPDGSASAGALLQNHFTNENPILTPGTSVARLLEPPPITLAGDTTTPATADVGNAVQLDGSSSAFPDQVTWSVAPCSGTPENPGTCAGSLPVVGSSSLLAEFLPDDTGTYQLMLTLDGGSAAASSSYYFQVPLVPPLFISPTPALSLQLGTQQTVLPSNLIKQYGNGGPSNNLLLIQPATADLAIAPASCAAAPGCMESTVAGGFTVSSVGNQPGSSSVLLTVKGLGSNPAESVSETVPVTLVASVQAPNIQLSPVAANSTIAAVTNLLTAVNSSGTYPDCSSLAVANVKYTGSRLSVWSFNAGTQELSYIPQAGFASFNKLGVSEPAVSPETFSYDLQCTLLSSQIETSTGQITVPVTARETFSDVQTIFTSDSTCASCHANGSAPPLGSASYSELRNGQTSDSIGGTVWTSDTFPFVDLDSLNDSPPDLSSVPSSALLCWPEQTCPNTHSGGAFPAATSELQTIRNWIEDGANDF
ncbi:MAG: PKD domain-containing protein [Steroidobacteraceae bacterium]